MIHIYLPFAKLIQLACCTARQQSGEPNTPNDVCRREDCHSICKQRRYDYPILGCSDSAEQMSKGAIRSRTNNHLSPLEFEREKGTEKKVRRVVLKAIRIKVSSRISPERLRNVPIIAATLRGGISYRWSWSPTGTQDEQETRRPSLIEKIFISSDVFMRLTAVFAGYIQGYILSLQKGLFSFSPIRPHSKVNCFRNRARFRINRTIHLPN